MRIGVDVGSVLHGHGGVASYTRQIVHGLARFADGHDLVLFDLDREARRLEAYQRVLGPMPQRVTCAAPRREELEKLDVFHAPGFSVPPRGAPNHVFTLHDLTVVSHPECHTLDNRVRTLVATAEALVRNSTVIAVSRATRAEAVRLLSLPEESVEVLPPILAPGFTPSGSDEEDATALNRLGVGSRFCLAVASLEPRKNLDRLLDAWDLLPERLAREHPLVLVASAGWLYGSLRRRLRSLQREGTVRLLAHVSEPELAALYRRARAVVWPSLVEGFGLPVAEAMACGAPVVTSDRSSMPEVAGGAAVLVDPESSDAIADGVIRVLTDQDLRRDLRERGPERALRFSAAEVVPRLLELYRRSTGRL